MARESKAPGIEAVPGFFSRQGIKEAEWQYALHSDFKVIMRPGWTWRARVLACIIRQSRGYRRDLAVMQVGGETKRDAPKLLPLFPGGIGKILSKLAIEAFQEAGVDPDEGARKRFKLDRTALREILESLEVDDGVIVRARSNGDPRKLIIDDLPLAEALARNRVVLLANLSKQERKRVSQRLLIYLLPKPKPASLKALNRHDDSFPQVGKITLPVENHGPIQTIFAFMRKQGLQGDVNYATALAQLPEVRQSLELYERDVTAAKEQLKAADKFMRDVVARVAAKTPPEGAVAQPAADTAQESLFRADQISSRPSASTGSTKGGDAGHSSLVSQPKSSPAPIAQSADTAGEYADGREHLKAIFRAKAGYDAPVDVMDRIELILAGKGKTFEEFVDALKPHLGGRWDIPPAFLTDRAKNIWLHVGAPRLKPKPRCPVCQADNQRGAILQNGAIVACPECSPPGWAEELAAKTRETTARQQTRSAS